MRSMLDREHELEAAASPSRDLVLGMPALFGIFLGVALVCAACFGFGYRSSRDFHLPAQHLAAAPSARRAPLQPRPLGGSSPEESSPEESTSDAESPETAYPTQAPERAPEQNQQRAPAEVAQGEAPPVPAARLKPSPSAGLPMSQRAPADDVPALPTRTAAPPDEQADAPAAPALRRVPSPAVATAPEPMQTAVGAGAMVQIAAVTRAADAQTLANALRHDGFDAIVRTSIDDRFFHVQIGPFPSLQAAKTVRGKLADNGYNAFIKP